MSPLGQSPNFLTDGSSIRCPPVDDTKNPTFRLAPSYIKGLPFHDTQPVFSGHRTKSRFEQLFFNLPPPYFLSDNLLTFWLTAAASAVRRSAIPKIQPSGLPVVHQRISNIRHLAAVPDPSSPPCFHLSGPVLHFCHASVISVPIFIWSQIIITFSLSNIRFPGNRPLFFAVNFPCRFSKKAPRSFLCSALLPLVSFPVLSFAAFSLFNVFLRPAPLLSFTRYHLLLLLHGSPLRPAFPFFAGIERNCPLSALLPIRFSAAPAQPVHDPKVLLSAHLTRQMVLPGLKIKISYPYQCYHKDGKGYQILFAVKVVTF